LREWRGKRSQSAAARKLGVPVKTFQNWEQGVRIPRGLALEALRKKIRGD
jgi:DNA-binding transcriptional regulator YiaG